jgi:hypothetical protein
MFKENDINPVKFYQIANVLKSVNSVDKSYIDSYIIELEPIYNELVNNCDILLKATDSMNFDAHNNLRKKINPFSSIEDLAKNEDDFKNVLDGKNFIHVAYLAIDAVKKIYQGTINTLKNLKPGELYFSNSGFARSDTNFSNFDSIDDIQKLFFEAQLNQPTINRFILAINDLDLMINYFKHNIQFIYKNIELYYNLLDHRHSVEGIEIQVNPIITDIALTIFENIDSHGEIQDGKKANEISAYSLRKAQILTSVLENKKILELITENVEFISFIKNNLDTVLDIVSDIKNIFKEQIKQIKSILDIKVKVEYVKEETVESLIASLEDLDPESIIFRNKTSLLSETEKFNLSFKNETIKIIVGLISNEEDKSNKIIQYVLDRKVELRKFFQDENSFYVCKIGTGNMFSGEAPGGLSVVPGVRPNVSLDEIVGLGVPEVKEFIKTIKSASKWHDLFVATSPSKSADKSNLLLVGPMGCLDSDTYIQYEIQDHNGRRINHKGGTIKRLYQRFNNLPQDSIGPKQSKDMIYLLSSMNDDGNIILNKITDVIASGNKKCFEITVYGGEKIIATADHKFFIGDKYVKLKELLVGDTLYLHKNVRINSNKKRKSDNRLYCFVKHHPICGTKIIENKYIYKRLAKSRAVMEAEINNLTFKDYISKLNSGDLNGLIFLPRHVHVHHKDENFRNNSLDNLEIIDGIEHNREHARKNHKQIKFITVEDKITSIKYLGVRETFDIKMQAPFHNFIANKFVVHNSGKTEVLRAIASEKDSIGVFSQGSDYGTAWANESQKNPKRMFEAGLKLQKESGKHVYFLIDEIDSVLNNDKNFSNMNLTLEFQILMDGVVSYPNLSVWGTTNSPQRIPMPMIRRFSKVIICGELEQPHRIHLLKQFLNYFPIKGFYDNEWETLAKRLEGATGDIVRKITDEIWRNKMSQFVQNNPTEAEEVVKFLNDGSQFQLSNFTNEKQEVFKNKLEKFISVTPDDVDKSITLHLNNIAIRKEIETAVDTYKAAKEFLFQLDSGSR